MLITNVGYITNNGCQSIIFIGIIILFSSLSCLLFAPSPRGDFIFWLNPKNEAKKIKAPDRFADFLQVIPCLRSKTQDRSENINAN
jgi:hypothetical protein